MLKNINNELAVKFEVLKTSYGWLDLRVSFADTEFTMMVSEIRCGLAALVDRLYYLYPDLGHDEYNFDDVEYGSCEGPAGSMITENPGEIVTWEDVPWKTEIFFDEEGSGYTWKLTRKLSLDTDFMVDINIEYSSSIDNKTYKCSVRYKELCYAVAKVCTEALKKYGLGGYQDSSWDLDINIRRLIFIKALALDMLDDIKSVRDENDEEKSNFTKELAILTMDM